MTLLYRLALESDTIAPRRLLMLVASVMAFVMDLAWAAAGAEVLKLLNPAG
jgi:hypothetical protein